METNKKRLFMLFAIACVLLSVSPIHAQNRHAQRARSRDANRLQQNVAQNLHTIQGTVYEQMPNGKNEPLPGASIFIEKIGVGTSSSVNGSYILKDIPLGEITVKVQFVGKVTIDTTMHIQSSTTANFYLQDDDFRLSEVVVTATSSNTGQSTASTISDKAIEHLQSVSLDNVLALLPGGITDNPTLNFASQLNIRSVSQDVGALDMNSLGSAIVQDGAPVSNNANLQTMNTSVRGAMGALGGTTSPSGGFDTRGISLENIESVEVIRGVPSVEYGDLTAGAVLVNSKAGRTPLRLKARTNPNVYQFFAQKGQDLGGNRGALNLSADYAYNTGNPVQSYRYYERFSTKVFYSNSLFNNKWKTNTILDLMHERDQRDRNPDDLVTETVSKGRDTRASLNTNGTFYINKGWFKNIKYTLSGSITDRFSHYESIYTSANAPYSMTTVDGAIIANRPGLEIQDVDGNVLTNYTNVDNNHYAVYLPSTYKGRNNIKGKEVNLFSKVTSTFYKRWDKIENRVLLGGEFRSEGNIGDGKTFDQTAPPLRNIAALNASFRPRSYDDIPFIQHGALYLEENFGANLTKKNQLRIQAGLRYDMMKDIENVFSPRVNASLEVIPKTLFIRGAAGITAKMPTLIYLYPEKAYFEYININESANDQIPQEERVFMTTNHSFETQNRNLKVATNKKTEIGFDLTFNKAQLYVTMFKENLKDGYSMSPIYKPVTYNQYKRAGDGSQPIYELKSSNPVLAEYFVPSNDMVSNTNGVEFDLNIKRIEAIRTAFVFTGAFMQSENYSSNFTFFNRSSESASSRTHIGLYGPAMSKRQSQRFSTALRATHNIPEIGFVITLTAETIWNQKDKYQFGNDTIPTYYISKYDGKQYKFDSTKKDEPEFRSILRNREDSKYIAESYPPLMNFNINFTKEISDFMRVSFFANNMFRRYPIVESKRQPGSYIKRNKNFFFGLEVNLLIN